MVSFFLFQIETDPGGEEAEQAMAIYMRGEGMREKLAKAREERRHVRERRERRKGGKEERRGETSCVGCVMWVNTSLR